MLTESVGAFDGALDGELVGLDDGSEVSGSDVGDLDGSMVSGSCVGVNGFNVGGISGFGVGISGFGVSFRYRCFH